MIPGLPYAQVIGAGALVLLVIGLCWACYRWGWKANEAKTLKMVLDTERRVTEAMEVARRRPLAVDREWMQRGSGPPGPSEPLPPASSAR